MKRLLPLLFFFVLMSGGCFFEGPKGDKGMIRESHYNLSGDLMIGTPIMSWGQDSVAKVYATDNTLCLTYNKNETVVELFDCISLKSIRKMVNYGQGQGEMLMVDYSFGDGKVVLTDIVKDIISVIDIDEAACNEGYIVINKPLKVNTQENIPFERKKMICLNPYSFNGMEKRFFITDPSKRYRERKHEYDSFNVVDGCLLYNKCTEEVVFLSMFEPTIELYSLDGIIKGLLTIERRGETRIKEIKNGKTTEYYFVNHIPFCFVDADSDGEMIVGAYLDENDESYIIVTSWALDSVQSYRIEGKVKSVCISGSGIEKKLLYLTREDERDCLMECKMNILS